MQHRFKGVTILRTVDIFQRGSQNFDTALYQLISQVDCRLTTKLHHNAQRLLQIDNMHDILYRQRLKVQLIGNGEIRGYRFRIVIDYNRLIAALTQGHDAVHRRIVKLHTLSDADRAGA